MKGWSKVMIDASGDVDRARAAYKPEPRAGDGGGVLPSLFGRLPKTTCLR